MTSYDHKSKMYTWRREFLGIALYKIQNQEATRRFWICDFGIWIGSAGSPSFRIQNLKSTIQNQEALGRCASASRIFASGYS
jgi:hypothetical protein